jgi:hypothetical protein
MCWAPLSRVGKWGAMGIHRFVSGPLCADDSQSTVKSVSVGKECLTSAPLRAMRLKGKWKAPAVRQVVSHRPPKRPTGAHRQTPAANGQSARNPQSKDDPIFDNSFDAHMNGREGAVFDTG